MKYLNFILFLIALCIADIANGQRTLWAQNGIKFSYETIPEISAVGKNNRQVKSWKIRCTWENNSGKTYQMTVGIAFSAYSTALADVPDGWRGKYNHTCVVNPGTYPNGSTRVCELRVYTYGNDPGSPGFHGGGGSFK